jgi:hypothetical protein
MGQPPELIRLAYDVQWTEPPNPSVYSIDFTPRIPLVFAPRVTKLRVEYDKATALPVGTWLLDNDGNWVRFEYHHGQTNMNVDPSAFEVELPAGTKINDAPDLGGVTAELFGLKVAAAK